MKAKSWVYSVNARVAVSVILGTATSLALSQTGYSNLALLWGWDLTSMIYIAWIGIALSRLDCTETSKLATSEDPDRLTVDILMVLASIASLAAVVLGLTQASDAHGVERTREIVTCVSSVVLSLHVYAPLRDALLQREEGRHRLS